MLVDGIQFTCEAAHLISIAYVVAVVRGVKSVERHPDRNETEEDISSAYVSPGSQGEQLPHDTVEFHSYSPASKGRRSATHMLSCL